MSDDTLYKALTAGGLSPYQGYEWPLPEGGEPGAWVEAGEGELVECEYGLHCCTIDQLPRWLGETLYIIEPASGTDRLDGEDKTVLRRARLTRRVEIWDETTARLYAADCAEMVLPIWEAEHPEDDRPLLGRALHVLADVGEQLLLVAQALILLAQLGDLGFKLLDAVSLFSGVLHGLFRERSGVVERLLQLIDALVKAVRHGGSPHGPVRGRRTQHAGRVRGG